MSIQSFNFDHTLYNPTCLLNGKFLIVYNYLIDPMCKSTQKSYIHNGCQIDHNMAISYCQSTKLLYHVLRIFNDRVKLNIGELVNESL